MQKKTDCSNVCGRLYKNIRATDVDLEWADTMICRLIYVTGKRQEIITKHDVDVLACLKAKSYWPAIAKESKEVFQSDLFEEETQEGEEEDNE